LQLGLGRSGFDGLSQFGERCEMAFHLANRVGVGKCRQAAHCAPLTTYAAALTTFADAYAIGQMEGHLAAFPKLAESIETASAQAQLQPV